MAPGRRLAAVKAISRHLFAIFGLDRRLKKERAKASKRLARKTGKQAPNGQANLSQAGIGYESLT